MKHFYKFLSIFFCLFSGIILTACFGHTHNMGDWTTKTPASCTQAEIKHRVCADCGHEETQTGSPKLGHNYRIEETVAPTQIQNGYIKYLCNCGENYKKYTCLLSFSSVILGENIDTSELPVINPKIVDKDSVFLGVEYSGDYMVSEYRIYYQNDTYLKINVGDIITNSTTITVVFKDKTQEQKQFENLLEKINKLEQISLEYNNQFNSTQNAYVRVLQYIRMERYNTSEWNLLGGTIEADFSEYVKTKQGEFDLETLKNLQNFVIPSTNEKVDFVHMIAIMDIAIKNGLSSNMANDLAGWGGDFCQLVAELKKLNLTGIDLQMKAVELLGGESSSFSEQDLCADLDAINITKTFEDLENKSISNAIKQYYNQFSIALRKTNFLQNAFAETFENEHYMAQHLIQRLDGNLYIKIWCGENNLDITNDMEIFNAVALAIGKYLLY